MNRLVYLIFASLTLGGVSVLGHIYFVEMALYLNILFFPFFSGGNKNNNQIIALDIFVIIYAILNLIPVAVDLNPLYESARHYRYMVLTPVLIYMVIRYLPVSTDVLKKGMYYLVGGTLIQSVLVVLHYFTYGGRAENVRGVFVNPIALVMLICISICVLLFMRNLLASRILRFLSMIAAALLFFAMIVSATRSATVGLIVLLPFASRIWKSRKYRKLLAMTMIGVLLLVLGVILTLGPSVIGDVELKNYREIGRSVDRLFSPELYLIDLKGRLALWTAVAKQALRHPLIGSGAASYALGDSAGVGLNLGSSHNMLISSLVISGIPGLILMFLLIGGTFHCLNKTIQQSGVRDALGTTVLISFTILLMVALTNDLSGGINFIFFILMALAARLSLLEGEVSNSNE